MTHTTNDAPVTVEPTKPGFYWCRDKYDEKAEWLIGRVSWEDRRLRVAVTYAGIYFGELYEYEWGEEIPHRIAALASAPADRSAAYDRLERHLDEHYYAGARDDLRQVASAPAGDGVEEAAINQNDRMRQELANVGNAVSALARAMGVDQANDDGSWPDLAGRVEKLTAAALARPRAAVGERPAVAAALCDDVNARMIAEQMDAPSFEESSAVVQSYWIAIAGAAILALQSPPAKVEG